MTEILCALLKTKQSNASWFTLDPSKRCRLLFIHSLADCRTTIDNNEKKTTTKKSEHF